MKNLVQKLPRHGTKKYSSRSPDLIREVIVHHSGVQCPPGAELLQIMAIARYHVEQRGWPGIAYHYVVGKSGDVYKTQPNTLVTYHAQGRNITSLGVCVLGNFTVEDPTQEQIRSLRELLETLTSGAYPGAVVLYHRDVSKTVCPGDRLILALGKGDENGR